MLIFENRQFCYKLLQLFRGWDTEFVTEDAPIPLVMTYRLAGVALGDMDPYHEAVCALSEWLGLYRGECGAQRVSGFVSAKKLLASRLQHMQLNLPAPFTLEKHPLVVPAR